MFFNKFLYFSFKNSKLVQKMYFPAIYDEKSKKWRRLAFRKFVIVIGKSKKCYKVKNKKLFREPNWHIIDISWTFWTISWSTNILWICPGIMSGGQVWFTSSNCNECIKFLIFIIHDSIMVETYSLLFICLKSIIHDCVIL